MQKPAYLSIARASLVCALTIAAGLVSAQPQQQQPPQHRGPPPEALAACKALKSGQDCSFTAPHGSVKGSCFAPEGKPLACRPKDAPAGPPPKK